MLLANAGTSSGRSASCCRRCRAGAPALMLRAGLFLYDHLGQRQRIPGFAVARFAARPRRPCAAPELTHGFAYWDCRVDDARLVVLNARAAAQRGAVIETRTRLVSAARRRRRVARSHRARRSRARGAARGARSTPPGHGCARSTARCGAAAPPARLRLVKGSHIVVPRITGANDAYLCQSADGRVVFAIPYEERFTLIGTTEIAYAGDPAAAAIAQRRRGVPAGAGAAVLCQPAGAPRHRVELSGVRPLYDDVAGGDASSVTRDYRFELSDAQGAPPCSPCSAASSRPTAASPKPRWQTGAILPRHEPAWTASSAVAGRGPGRRRPCGLHQRPVPRPSRLRAAFLGRLARRYGTLTEDVLGDAQRESELGQALGGGLSEREVVYLREHEWAREPDDVLWRRTKCGLHMSDRAACRGRGHYRATALMTVQ